MRALLLSRLQAIAAAVRARPEGLALLGLGSCADQARLDDHSDLDFFVIVQPGSAHHWRDHLDWLEDAGDLTFAHRNTPDGCKVLYTDGVFCEFAVFEPAQLPSIPFAPGQIIWARDGFDTGLLEPLNRHEPTDPDWHAREALTDLLIGLKRLHRGERLSGADLINHHAARHVILAVDLPVGGDPFDPIRRLEQRSPELASQLTACLGATADDQALKAGALGLLRMLQAHRTVAPSMAAAIEAMA
jgi:lincosamide nucleotidyltransferase B/F